jgi:hypothetical protein
MTTLKIIIHELSTAPESLLQEVTNFIKSAKVDAAVSDRLPRTPGLHQGKVWMSDKFNYWHPMVQDNLTLAHQIIWQANMAMVPR